MPTRASISPSHRDSRTLEHFVAEQLGPQRFDLRRLGEEAVPADVEAEALVLDRSRKAADVFAVRLENDHVVPGFSEQVRGREAGGAGADYERLSARALAVHSRTDGILVTVILYLPALALRDAKSWRS